MLSRRMGSWLLPRTDAKIILIEIRGLVIDCRCSSEVCKMSAATPRSDTLREAALSTTRVAGLTHLHYKYPARSSPTLVAAVIREFSSHGDTILDPYMGGGTTIVEASAAGRRAIGCDLNPLAVFIARVKTTPLSSSEVAALENWAHCVVPKLLYHNRLQDSEKTICPQRTRNLHLPRARPIKKFLAMAIEASSELPSTSAREFARCVLLNVGQWALDGRRRAVALGQFRERVTQKTIEMIAATQVLAIRARESGLTVSPTLINGSAENLAGASCFLAGTRVGLVITSPPYPGVHILYHRWQVDGRKETPAPYWIADCMDGHGGSYYTFGDRQSKTQDEYFANALRTLRGVRAVMRPDGTIVQVIAFSNQRAHLQRYLRVMETAGFRESLPQEVTSRIWRSVPGRAWHATLKGPTASAREVVLVHKAV